MSGTSPVELAGFVVLTGLFVSVFIYSRDMVQKQLSMFTASYFVFVFFSNAVFGLDFSSKTYIGNFGIDIVTANLVFFWFSFYFASTMGIRRAETTVVPLRMLGGRGTTINTLILSVPIIAFFAYYTFINGIRMTGEFVEFRGQRSTTTDYVFVYYAALLAYFQNSRLLLAVGVIAATSHFLSAERLRSFVYIIVIFINYYRLDTRQHFASVFFLLGFVVATALGQLRTGSLTGNQDYNITHFGSVTVSSLYLLDFGSTISTSQKLMFSIGTVIANLAPASLVPEGFNIRRSILNFATIPGGGWLPVFVSVQAGLIGVVGVGLVMGKCYQKALAAARHRTTFQPAYYAAVIVFIATTPRWFMYTPYQVLKMPLYAFVLTALLVLLSKLLTGRKVAHRT